MNAKHTFPLILVATLLLASCDTLRSFMARDLADEDFIIGQLYVDEMVHETPAISVSTNKPSSSSTTSKPSSTGKTSSKNPLGLEYSPTDNADLYDLVASWLGVPYKYGGTDRKGIDCSAFVGIIYDRIYSITLHRTSNEMLRDVSLISKSQLAEGDILFFTNSKGKVSHVGVYLKDGLFAHASTSNGVCVSRIDDTYWSRHFYKGGRAKR